MLVHKYCVYIQNNQLNMIRIIKSVNKIHQLSFFRAVWNSNKKQNQGPKPVNEIKDNQSKQKVESPDAPPIKSKKPMWGTKPAQYQNPQSKQQSKFKPQFQKRQQSQERSFQSRPQSQQKSQSQSKQQPQSKPQWQSKQQQQQPIRFVKKVETPPPQPQPKPVPEADQKIDQEELIRKLEQERSKDDKGEEGLSKDQSDLQAPPAEPTRLSIFFHNQVDTSKKPKENDVTHRKLLELLKSKDYAGLRKMFNQNLTLESKYPQIHLHVLVRLNTELGLQKLGKMLKQTVEVGTVQVVVDQVLEAGLIDDVNQLAKIISQVPKRNILGKVSLKAVDKFLAREIEGKPDKMSSKRVDVVTNLLKSLRGNILADFNLTSLKKWAQPHTNLKSQFREIEYLVEQAVSPSKSADFKDSLIQLIKAGNLDQLLVTLKDTLFNDIGPVLTQALRTVRIQKKFIPFDLDQIAKVYEQFRPSGNTLFLKVLLIIASECRIHPMVFDMYQNYFKIFNQMPIPQSVTKIYANSIAQFPISDREKFLKNLNTLSGDPAIYLKSLIRNGNYDLAIQHFGTQMLSPTMTSFKREHLRIFLYHYYMSLPEKENNAMAINQFVLGLDMEDVQEMFNEEEVANNQVAYLNHVAEAHQNQLERLDREQLEKQQTNQQTTDETQEKEDDVQTKLAKLSGKVKDFTSDLFWEQTMKNRRADQLIKLQRNGELDQVTFGPDYADQMHFNMDEYSDLIKEREKVDLANKEFKRAMDIYLLELESIMYGLIEDIDDIFLNRYVELVKTATPEMRRVLNYYSLHQFDLIRSDPLTVIKVIKMVRDHDFRIVQEMLANDFGGGRPVSTVAPSKLPEQNLPGAKPVQKKKFSRDSQEENNPRTTDGLPQEHDLVDITDISIQTLYLMRNQLPFSWQISKQNVRLPDDPNVEDLILFGIEQNEPIAVYMGEKLAMYTGQTISHTLAKRVEQMLDLTKKQTLQMQKKIKAAMSYVGPIDRSKIYDFYYEYKHIFVRTDYNSYLQYLEEHTFFPHQHMIDKEKTKFPVRWSAFNLDYKGLYNSIAEKYTL